MISQILIVTSGVLIILLLAQLIIRNSTALAAHYRVSGTFIGLTLLSIGTSIPEILTHIIGSIDILKYPDKMNEFSALLLGTNVGSDIFQQNFVLPIIGIIGTIIVHRKNLWKEMGVLIMASLMLWLFSLGGLITRTEGALLLLAYIGYLVYLHRDKVKEEYESERLSKKEVRWTISLIAISFIIMAFTADQVLSASIVLISKLPLSASFFGIIILGIASALPELTTSIIAVTKKRHGMSAGILIGSNITNPLLGIGIGALISTYTVPAVIGLFDLPVKIITAFLLLYFLLKSHDLKRPQAAILIGIFILYIIIRQVYFPTDL